jgi:outer membrane receptor protein involved in Fe transport
MANSTGKIRGVVADKDANPMPGVTVVVSNEKLGVKDRGVVTDLAGNYRIPGLSPGTYRMIVSFPTFATIELDLVVEPGKTARKDIILRPSAELTHTIEVRGTTGIVEMENTQNETNFDDTFIEGLPVVGRDYRDVLVLAPGVSDEDGDGNINIHGSRDRDVMYSVDGVNVTDPFTGQNAVDVNLEAIGDIEMVRAGGGAEFGGKSGGFVNITTKSGTNDFEGSFKFFFRTSELDGDGAGTDPPELHGGIGEASSFRDVDFDEFRPFMSLGGAVVQDRMWYFVSAQYISIDTPVNALNQVFITNDEGFQNFAKLTMQANSAVKPSLSLQHVPFLSTNLGLNSFVSAENAWDLETNRSIVTLDVPYIISPRLFLETTLSYDNGTEEFIPVTSPDVNGNGIQFRRAATGCPGDDCLDANRDGFVDDNEDPGGFFSPRDRDLGEDFNSNGRIDPAPEGFGSLPGLCIQDGNGLLRCEGDNVGPTSFGNGDGILAPGDQDQVFDFQLNRQTGPNAVNYTDLERDRQAFRSVLSQEIDDFYGTHTLKYGAALDAESFHRDLFNRAALGIDVTGGGEGVGAGGNITAQVPVPGRVSNLQAEADFYGLFVDDKYKPIPNLTLGLGVRFDRSEINTTGYSHFDPVRERAVFQRVQQEIAKENAGLIFTDPILNFQQQDGYTQSLGRAAVNQFTAHHLATAFDSDNTFVQLRKEDRLQGGAESNSQQLEDFQITNNNLSPRVSFSYDPWATGKTKFYSTWGRYYDRIFLSAATWELFPSVITRDYLFDTDLVNDTTGLFNRGFGDKLTVAAPSTLQMDRRLEDPYSDEFTIGFERELAPELSLQMTYVNRSWQDQLQDVDINHLVGETDVTGRRLRNVDGTNVVDLPDGLPDINIQNFFFNQVLFLGNLNEQEYEGIELVLNRRQHRNWQMQASYIYSQSEGAAEDFATEEGNDPTVTENEFGFLDFDRTHVVKFSATTFLKRDFQLGGTVEWASGYPWSTIRRRRSNDDVGYVTFRRRYPTGQRNDQRNDNTWLFNLALRKSFVIGKISAAATLDVQNLLNSDELRVFEINDSAVTNQVFGVRDFGRRYELGLVLNF